MSSARLIKIGARNLWRSKRRTLLTGGVLVLTFAMGLWTMQFDNGIVHNLIDGGARDNQGHVTIRPIVPEGEDRATFLLDEATVQDALATANGDPTVRAVATRINPRLEAQVLAQTAHGATGLRVVGYDPRNDPELRQVRQITSGAALTESDKDGLLLGDAAARRLHIEVGDRVVLGVSAPAGGELQLKPFHVRGIFHTALEPLDAGGALALRESLSELTGKQGASYISVLLRSQDDTDLARDALATAFRRPGAEVVTWRETLSDMTGIQKLQTFMQRLARGGMLLLIGFMIMNTLLMASLERTSEYALLSAVGARPTALWGIVLSEATTLGLLSVLIGGLIEFPIYLSLMEKGIDLRSMSNADFNVGGVAVDPIVHLTITSGEVIFFAALLIVMTILASLPPAIRVMRLDPVKVFGR